MHMAAPPRSLRTPTCKGAVLRLPSLRRHRQHRNRIRQAAPSTQTEAVGTQTFDAEKQKLILAEDLSHLFDDQGVDPALYDANVDFRDPITKYDSLQGYLFNIAFLKRAFSPTFQLHDVRQTGPWELTSRWTMTMTFLPATATPLKHLWSPRLIFTGTSIYGYNPANGRINRHWDTWDSINSQDFFSVEGFQDFLAMVTSPMRPPAPQLADYTILQRRKAALASDPLVYEIRSYPPADKQPAPATSGTPAYTSYPAAALDASTSGRTPSEGGTWAALAFTGDSGDADVAAQLRRLKAALQADGLEAGPQWCLAKHQDGSVPAFVRRSEVLIPLVTFDVWSR